MTEDEIVEITIEFADDGDAWEVLETALKRAYPETPPLARLVKTALNVDLTQTAGDDTRSAHWQLIKWADSQGQILHLIAAVMVNNPGNGFVKRFLRDYPRYREGAEAVAAQTAQKSAGRSAQITTLFRVPPQPMHFDMGDHRALCRGKIEKAYDQGSRLILLPVLADELDFVDPLCERIVAAPLATGRAIKKDLIDLTPASADVAAAVDEILIYRPNLAALPVVCPVRLAGWHGENGNTAVAHEFCTALRDQFAGIDAQETKYPLIVVIAAPANVAFPAPYQEVKGPCFLDDHVYDWTGEATHEGWAAEWLKCWRHSFITACRSKTTADNDRLMMRRVYRHLGSVKRWVDGEHQTRSLNPAEWQGLDAEYARFREFLHVDLPQPQP